MDDLEINRNDGQLVQRFISGVERLFGVGLQQVLLLKLFRVHPFPLLFMLLCPSFFLDALSGKDSQDAIKREITGKNF
jgi:hypothetical protein